MLYEVKKNGEIESYCLSLATAISSIVDKEGNYSEFMIHFKAGFDKYTVLYEDRAFNSIYIIKPTYIQHI